MKNNIHGFSHILNIHTAPVKSIDFSPTGKFLVSGGNDKIIKIYSIGEDKILSNINNNKYNIKTVRVSPDSCLIASGGDDKCVKIWDINKQIQIMNYYEHLKSTNCIRWSPDGVYLASSSNDHTIKLYDIRCNKSIQNIEAHNNAVTSISFHPSKQYLVSCSLDSTIKIWDLFNNILLYTIYGHEGPIYSLSFNKTGEFICSGGTDADLYLWRNNINGNLIPNSNKTMGGEAYPELEKIPKNKTKKPYHLRSKSSHKFSVNMRSPNNSEYPRSNFTTKSYFNYNLKKRNNISQSNSKSGDAISTNIDSNEINNNINNSLFAKKMQSDILDNFTNTMQKMNQRVNILETKLSALCNLPNNKYYNIQNNELISSNNNNQFNDNNNNSIKGVVNNGKDNEELYNPNPEALKEAMDYYNNIIKKDNNDNPVEIFEDVNNHVEDIRQEVMNNNNQDLKRNEIIEIYNYKSNYNDNNNLNK